MTKSSSTCCPLCGKPANQQLYPFCSNGCKDRDLINWLDERYRAPARDEEADSRASGLDSSA
ncbi:MAG: DNA gyrase inhibitor YacG [Alphaproteobacteria bacterium]|nr:DNA gyrase inhibitor YacG [Alphaproteobacteria bacterium]MDE2041576.1 DNA gyrase inhibitor YacG [Alphaproteobacteria bacterium]MDE2341567.1 DNA gyrase inhibitor YacG [Alphaproteobacteria bacterium]